MLTLSTPFGAPHVPGWSQKYERGLEARLKGIANQCRHRITFRVVSHVTMQHGGPRREGRREEVGEFQCECARERERLSERERARVRVRARARARARARVRGRGRGQRVRARQSQSESERRAVYQDRSSSLHPLLGYIITERLARERGRKGGGRRYDQHQAKMGPENGRGEGHGRKEH
eukprot:1498147-Rhodomonas_salina.1